MFTYNDHGNSFYVIIKGQVGLHVPIIVGETKVFSEASVWKTGEGFGELGLINDVPRAATVKWKKNTHFWVLDK